MTSDSLQLEKLVIDLVSQNVLSENGQTKNLSNTLERLEDKDDTLLTNLLKTPSRKRIVIRRNPILTSQSVSVTAECPLKDKETILKDKLPSCVLSTPNIQSLQTLGQVSISTENPSNAFWSFQAKDLSKKLWLPIETDSVVSPLNSFHGSFTSMESKSWFSMKRWEPQTMQNLQKTSSQSLMFSIAESMEKENTQKKTKTPKKKLTKPKNLPPNTVRKILLKPTPEVKQKLKQWFGCVRTTYNWALACIKDKPKEYPINFIWLRKRFINKCNIPKRFRYLLDTPKHVRDSALKDLEQAFKMNFEKKKNDSSHNFEMKFRSKKKEQSFTIPKDFVKMLLNSNENTQELKMYPTFLKSRIKFYLRKNDKDFGNISYDCKLQMDCLGRIFLIVPKRVIACENQTSEKHDWASLDPGVRDFQTVYCPEDNIAFKIGSGDIKRLTRLCICLDSLISKVKLEKNKHSRRQKKKACYRVSLRIRNLVKEVHRKGIRFLLDNFKNIIIPPFQVSQMVKRKNRKINSKTARNLLCWSHYKFRTLLIHKASLEGVNVFVRGEEYTTKKCTNCLTINPNVKGQKILKCPYCRVKIDRDLNGSRNIFLKNISVSENISETLPR